MLRARLAFTSASHAHDGRGGGQVDKADGNAGHSDSDAAHAAYFRSSAV